MIELRKSALLPAATVGCIMLLSAHVQAQWWGSRAPADYEDCADAAEQAASKEAKASALAECSAKFAGRRKPGGGYTYFDFMQNRRFDIAGQNPTPEEQKQIDEQYIVYLEEQRRSAISAAFTAKQQQLQQATLRAEPEKTPLPPERPRPQPTTDLRSRAKFPDCARHSFSCDGRGCPKASRTSSGCSGRQRTSTADIRRPRWRAPQRRRLVSP